MSTYGYSLCRHCGGSGKADAGECTACHGAGLTSSVVSAESCKAVAKPKVSGILQARTVDFKIPRHAEVA